MKCIWLIIHQFSPLKWMTVYTKLKNKLASDGAGEMAQHLGGLAADAGC